MRRHLAIILPALLALMLFGAVNFFYVLPQTKAALMAQNRIALRQLVGSVVTLLESYQTQVEAGMLEMEDAQARALSRVWRMRYGKDNKDYFWINDLSPHMLMHPYVPELVGQDLSTYQDSEGVRLFMEMVELAARQGGGFVSYKWQWKDEALREEAKLSYVQLFRPWGWIVGTGIYIADVEAEVARMTKNLVWTGFGVFGLIGLVTLYLIGRNLSSEAARNRVVDELQRSERKHRDLFESARDGIIVFKNLKIIDLNPAAEKMIGYRREELLGRTPLDFSPKLQSPELTSEQHLANCAAAAEKFGTHTFEWLARRADGQLVTAEISIGKAGYEDDTLLALVRDVTERKKAEQERENLHKQLRQAQKMEAIGTLAGGIAHDFNNILTAIMGYNELTMLSLEGKEPEYTYLEQVMNGCVRARDLIRQILTFSRQTEQEGKPVRISSLIEEALGLMRATLPATVEIRTNITSSSLVLCDPSSVHQVVMNLCTNAGHAMRDEGGVLSVNLTDMDVDEAFSASHPEIRPGRHLKLEVTDTGHGMPPEVQERIFEPFFSTKEREKGTGMGLAVTHGIVKSMGGMILVRSAPGQGATFQVILPIIQDDVDSASSPA